jgi:hypothetical protein
MHDLASFTDKELYRELAHARNRRDSHRQGHEPQEVLQRIRAILDEFDRRRTVRREEQDIINLNNEGKEAL